MLGFKYHYQLDETSRTLKLRPTLGHVLSITALGLAPVAIAAFAPQALEWLEEKLDSIN